MDLLGLLDLLGMNKSHVFFQMFYEAIVCVSECADELASAIHDPSQILKRTAAAKEIERKCDTITRAIVDKANQTFVTPFDRDDIYMLAKEIDDMADYIYGALEKMYLFRPAAISDSMKKISDLHLEAISMIKAIIFNLDKISKNKAEIMDSCRKINELERKADRVYREGLAAVFTCIKDPIEVIKQKELCEYMEAMIDQCSEVSDTVKGLVLKYA